MKTLRVLAGLALAFTAFCAWPAAAPVDGGVLKFAVGAEPPNYDCHAQTSFAFIHPVRPHYSTLLKFDAANYPKIVGDLAESWTVAKDGLTYTFKLRRGVKFHDGSAFSSEDIKATYDRIRKPPPGVLSVREEGYADISVIETPDPQTVVFYEVYDDRAAFDAHLETPHLARFRDGFPALIEEERPVRFLGRTCCGAEAAR